VQRDRRRDQSPDLGGVGDIGLDRGAFRQAELGGEGLEAIEPPDGAPQPRRVRCWRR